MLKNKLIEWAEKYEVHSFTETNLIKYPKQYSKKEDIEISALICCWINLSSNRESMQIAENIEKELFKGNPIGFIMGGEWEKYKGVSKVIFHYIKYDDFYRLCDRLRDIYDEFGTLEAYIASFAKVKQIRWLMSLLDIGVDYKSDMANKRLSTFLRWMCRKNSPVDIGIWDVFPQNCLLMSIDKMILKHARTMGITSLMSANIGAADELSYFFSKIFPNDPSKGDFAMIGYAKETKGKMKFAVEDLSIADVILLPIFAENVEKEIEKWINDRHAARMEAKHKGTDLKAHPIDGLNADGYLKVDKFILNYAMVMDKCSNLSAAQRETIVNIGNLAFHTTMRMLIDKQSKDEAANNNSIGNSKQ